MSRPDVGVFARPNWADAFVGERFDYLMDYMFWVGNDVVFYARSQNLDVHELQREDAVREKVEEALRDANPVFFFHGSHGGENVLTGQGMSDLIGCPGTHPFPDPNEDVLADRVTYTLSCSSAKELGPRVIEVGGISYMGYLPYLWIIPLEGDDLDAVFKDIWAGGAKVLIDGKTIGEAYNWVQRRYEHWIAYWEMNPGWEAPLMLSALRGDLENVKLFGKRDARIRSVQAQVELQITERVHH